MPTAPPNSGRSGVFITQMEPGPRPGGLPAGLGAGDEHKKPGQSSAAAAAEVSFAPSCSKLLFRGRFGFLGCLFGFSGFFLSSRAPWGFH